MEHKKDLYASKTEAVAALSEESVLSASTHQ